MTDHLRWLGEAQRTRISGVRLLQALAVFVGMRKGRCLEWWLSKCNLQTSGLSTTRRLLEKQILRYLPKLMNQLSGGKAYPGS